MGGGKKKKRSSTTASVPTGALDLEQIWEEVIKESYEAPTSPSPRIPTSLKMEGLESSQNKTVAYFIEANKRIDHLKTASAESMEPLSHFEDDEGTVDGFSSAESEDLDQALGCSAELAYKKSCNDDCVANSSIVGDLRGGDSLEMSNVQMTDRDMLPIAAALTQASLSTLCLKRTGLTARGVGALMAGLKGCPALTDINLNFNINIGDEAIGELAVALASACHRMRSMSFAHCDLRDGAARTIGIEFRNHEFLEILDVSENKIEEMDTIVPLLDGSGSIESRGKRNGGLSTLLTGWNLMKTRSVCDCVPTGIGCATATLFSLDLSCNSLGDDAGLAIAAGMNESSALNFLDVSRNKFGPDSARAFAASISDVRTLEVLKLGWNPLGTDGASEIIRTVRKGPRRGRIMLRAALRLVTLQCTADFGDEYKLFELEKSAHESCKWNSVCYDSFTVIELEYPTRGRLKVRMSQSRQQQQLGANSECTVSTSSAVKGIANGAVAVTRPQSPCKNPPFSRMTEIPWHTSKPLIESDPVLGEGSHPVINGKSEHKMGRPAEMLPPKVGLLDETGGNRTQNSLSALAMWSRRREESSHCYDADGVETRFSADWAQLLSRNAFREEIMARGIVTNPTDFVTKKPAKPSKKHVPRLSSRRPTNKTQPTTPRHVRLNQLVVPPTLAELETVLRQHHAWLVRVFRHFAAYFGADDDPTTKVCPRTFSVLIDSFGLMDRRRLCANATAIKKLFYEVMATGVPPSVSSKSSSHRCSRNHGSVPEASKPTMCRANFIAALVIHISKLLYDSIGNSGKNSASIDCALLAGTINEVVENARTKLLARSSPRSLSDPDELRRSFLYTGTVDSALKPHLDSLGNLYSRYAQTANSGGKIEAMSMGGWLRLLRDASMIQGDPRIIGKDVSIRWNLPIHPSDVFDGDFTVSDARCCFNWGRLSKEERGTTEETLTRTDFVEALCWLSLFKPVPSSLAMRAASNWKGDEELVQFFSVVDDPRIHAQPEIRSYVDAPTGSPISSSDLATRVLKILVVLFVRICGLEHNAVSVALSQLSSKYN